MSREHKRAATPPPRLLTKAQAAQYLGVCAATFDKWVASGVLPAALAGIGRWDIRGIDAALDRMSGLAATEALDPFTEWKMTRDARKTTEVARCR